MAAWSVFSELLNSYFIVIIHRPIKVNTKGSDFDERNFVGTFVLVNARYDSHIFRQFTSRTG